MANFSVAFAVFMLSALAISQAAVYIGGGCYDCNPPGGQARGVYTGLNGGGGGRLAGGGGGGGGGGGSYYNGGGGGRPVYSGNFGPNGYSGGGGRRGGGGYRGGGYGGGGGADYDTGLTQIISG
ncbi:glycine-rich RNA-binding protein 7 isoform X1 [Drosophila grimshawi]|uniref:GH19807 n=1 Tax=Drosophila grimshawi TaxID=7222 RepID=B4JRM2_DROGR|nr:glycine-rich RNA-binding protein 7 isoform X1 [Drosophila grimshawi]EDV94412.1 GH19807 [Drosophila grimshawi]